MNIKRVKYKDIEQIPKIKIKTDFKGHFFGSSPAPFIGRFGYPKVNIGVLSPQITGDTSYYHSPKDWSQKKAPISEVANLRYGLVNSRMQWNIKKVHQQNKFMDICQEAGITTKAIELEVDLEKTPQVSQRAQKEIIPFGPASTVKKARVTANTKVDTRIDRVVSDTDLKANKGILNLYKKGFQESQLNKILSVGTLGLKKNRKLVPTRWSITAVDDTVGKQLIEEVKQLPTGDFAAYFGGGWGNYYLFLFYPDIWSYELFETYMYKDVNPWSKNNYVYSTDYENYKGRKKYAEETAGGYYAARLPILEKMKTLKRQHSCLALRFITSEYNVPLGVWVCREGARNSVKTKGLRFDSEKLMLDYARTLIKNKFGFNIDLHLKQSKLLKNRKQQSKLTKFFN